MRIKASSSLFNLSQGVNITREEATAFFREKDKDRDGFISLEEYVGKARDVRLGFSNFFLAEMSLQCG